MTVNTNGEARDARRTKWQILEARRDGLRASADAIEDELAWMARTPFTANGTGECSTCRTPLPTEGDFARHFLVDDERYLNLGSCPNRGTAAVESLITDGLIGRV
jgi:hypothetical protein